MKQEELIKLIESVIDGHKGFELVGTNEVSIRVYSDTDIFTAVFISQVVEMTGDYFTGITNDADGRPYILFNL